MNDRMLCIQPAGGVLNSPDATPINHVTLRIQNDSDAASSVTVSYDVYIRNDQARSNELLFSYSTDGTSFTAVPAATYTSPGAVTGTDLELVGTINALTDAGISVGPNEFIYFRWTGADVSGGGARDEFGIDNVSVNLAAGAELISTTTTLDIVSPLNAKVNEAITFQGTVNTASGDQPITGAIQIRDGGPTGTLLGSTTDLAGEEGAAQFSFPSTTVPVGTYANIQALFVPGQALRPAIRRSSAAR